MVGMKLKETEMDTERERGGGGVGGWRGSKVKRGISTIIEIKKEDLGAASVNSNC